MVERNWKQTAELFGIAAIVASLVFVGLQMRQTDEIATIELLNETNTRMREMKTLISDNADIWSRGCLGDELSEMERVQFGSLYTAYTNTVYISWKRLIVADLSDVDPQYLINGLAANLHRFSGLRSMREARGEWDENGRQYVDPYISLYIDEVRKRLTELAEIEPEPLIDVTWCGRM